MRNVKCANKGDTYNTTINNNNVIINFSQDNYDIITKEFLDKILTNDMVYNEFIRTIIDNVSSERQNYKITNLRSKYALVYENGIGFRVILNIFYIIKFKVSNVAQFMFAIFLWSSLIVFIQLFA